MAILKINPTRINLLNLRKKLASARRGYKLLKDKRDGLMRRFLSVIREAWKLRGEIETEMVNIRLHFMLSQLTMLPDATDRAIFSSDLRLSLKSKISTVMSVMVPNFEIEKTGSVNSQAQLGTSGDFVKAASGLDKIADKLILLASLEEEANLLALEIEKTRRRVNALEHILIPNLQQTIRFIYMRLEEQARDAVVSTMRVKAMIEQKSKL